MADNDGMKSRTLRLWTISRPHQTSAVFTQEIAQRGSGHRPSRQAGNLAKWPQKRVSRHCP